jgi:putative multiple sugar transport system ATP-binding protein
MVGRDMVDRFPERTAHPIGEVTFAIEDWTVFHPLDQQRKVVDGVSINVRRGEVVGLAGLMGAGRTELAMSVFGRSYGKKGGGSVFKDGKEIRTRTVSEAISHRIAYATEDRKHYGLNLMDDIARSVTLASLSKVSRLAVINEHEETVVAERFRTDMRIKAQSVKATTGNLSGGNQQKVVLSKWIFADPDVLILDEPTRGIDVGAKYEIYTIINSLAAEGKAVIVISSELPELIGLCDRIYTLNEGRLTGEVAREDAAQETLMRYMMKGRAT